MEDLCNRVLWISKSICKELDHVSLVNFKDTSRDITKNLESERFYWISNRSALVLFNLFLIGTFTKQNSQSLQPRRKFGALAPLEY